MIQAGVARLVQGKTLIVIAHRLSTIAGADKIFVVNGGRVVEEGTHGELLAKGRLYAKMWESHIEIKDNIENSGKEGAVALWRWVLLSNTVPRFCSVRRVTGRRQKSALRLRSICVISRWDISMKTVWGISLP